MSRGAPSERRDARRGRRQGQSTSIPGNIDPPSVPRSQHMRAPERVFARLYERAQPLLLAFAMNEHLSEILAHKGNTVHRVPPTATVAQAVRVMVERRIGSIVVMDGELVVGIFTERDCLNRVLDAGLAPALTRVRD